MLRFFVSAWLLAGLAGCAAAPKPVAAAPPAAAPPAAGEQGVILARHRVPPNDPQPIRRLLGRLGADPAAQDGTEFIVRTDAGAVLSIVSPGRPTLLVGQRVSILRGQPARLAAAAHVVAAR